MAYEKEAYRRSAKAKCQDRKIDRWWRTMLPGGWVNFNLQLFDWVNNNNNNNNNILYFSQSHIQQKL